MANATSLQTILARSRVYGFLSRGFGEPDAALPAQLQREHRDLQAGLVRLKAPACRSAARPLRSILAPLVLAEMQASFLRCFGHAISKDCPPYEGEYGQAHIFQQTQRLADIAGFYRAFGLEPATDVHERMDHISVELEFMQFLCRKEAYALEHRHEAAQRAQCREAQRKFLDQHLGTWAPGFAQRLARVAEGGLYGALAELLGAFLSAELREFDLQPQPLAVARFPEPAPEGCLGCGAAPGVAGLQGG